MADGNLMENALHRYVDETDVSTLFDDDIDTFDESGDTGLEFETDDDGNYIRILEHLTESIEVGESKPSFNNRGEVFHESVIETIIEEWQHCRQMCTKLLPEYPYAGIMVDTKIPEIDGFTAKHRKDEQKGTIIECINSGRIATLMTPALLQRQYFVFLPNAHSLSSMQEFPLLTEPTYKVCFVSRHGEVQFTDIEISYKSIANMIVKDLCIQDILISAMEGYDASESDDVEEHDFDYSDLMDGEGGFSGDDEDDEFLFNGGDRP